VWTAHRAAKRVAAHLAGTRVRAARQEAARAGQESNEETAADCGQWRRRSGHQGAGRVRRRVEPKEEEKKTT